MTVAPAVDSLQPDARVASGYNRNFAGQVDAVDYVGCRGGSVKTGAQGLLPSSLKIRLYHC